MSRPPLWTDGTASEATGGEASAPFEADGVAFDSREVADRDLFVALRGERTDGHRFVGQALARGASAAMVDHSPESLAPPAPLLLVVDTADGLRDLARAARARTGARVAAVTGSVGKTGIKEALREVLGRQGAAHVSEKSFNNHVGTPLSLARMPCSSRFGVFEIGTNAPGEVAPLASLVRPHVALVTTVEAVHAGNFESEQAIAAEKASIFEGLEAGGVALINGDNRHAEALRACAERSPAGEIALFGSGPGCDHRLVAWTPDETGSAVRASIGGREVDYRLGLHGRHQALNSVAVLAVAHHLGADVGRACRDLGHVRAPAGRGARHVVEVDGGTALVIDESYNASPVAMAAALDVLGATPPGDGGRRIAVLGDMAELGDGAARAHMDLAGALAGAGVDLFYAVGPMMNLLYGRMAPENCGGAAGDARSMAALAHGAVGPGDVVLVKGSRSVGLELVVEALRAGAPDGRRSARG